MRRRMGVMKVMKVSILPAINRFCVPLFGWFVGWISYIHTFGRRKLVLYLIIENLSNEAP